MSLPFLQNYLGLSSGLQTRQASAGGGGIGGWVELGRTTLTGANANITVSSLANKRYLMVLSNKVGSSSANFDYYRFGNGSLDTGANYAYRYSSNGGADSTTVSTTDAWTGAGSSTTPTFNVAYIANYSTKEKLIMNQFCGQSTAGAGTAPVRAEQVSKWANTSNVIDTVSFSTLAAPTFDTGSEVVVLGYDPADTHTTNFWTELGSEDWVSGTTLPTVSLSSNYKYLWVQFWTKGAGTNRQSVRLGKTTIDTGTNYAQRYSENGAADGTSTSTTNFLCHTGNKMEFCNMFIVNNSANEKLAIWHVGNTTSSGAGSAPGRLEGVGKWTNTSNQIDRIQVFDTSENFTGGQIKVWGSN